MIGLIRSFWPGVIAALIAAVAGFAYGVRVGTAQELAARALEERAAERIRADQQQRIDASAQRHQSAEFARQSTVREIHRETQKVIDRPEYRGMCIDADGVGLLDRAASAANGESLAPIAGAAAAPSAGAPQ